jgi:L-ascorbate metabolism protein UlaG (beta-lactamase superfamily)
MVITWYGKNCFKLQSGELVIVTDPFEKESKLSPFRGRTDIIIRTTAPLSNNKPQPAEAFEVSYPGEYEVKNVSIKGWALPAQAGLPPAKNKQPNEQNLRTVYLAEIDEMKIVLLGHISDEGEIKNIQEYLEDADIIFVPGAGKPLIEVAAAAKLIRQLKPSLVVPTLYDSPKDLKPFIKELGKNEPEPQEKLTVSKKDLSKEKLLIGCLKI